LAPALFRPIRLRGLTLPNRIVVSPMCQYASADGLANDWHLMHLGQLSMGAAGLVFTEATHVSAEGRISPRCLGLWSDRHEEALGRVVRFCRTHGVTALGMQLAHAGRKGSTRPPLDGGQPLAEAEGAWPTLAPSTLPYGPGWHTPRAADVADLAKIRGDFVDAARRAARLGFDIIELHMAHGYLLHEFLSPLSNRREDGHGGDLDGRMRFPLEVFDAVRAVWPEERPLAVRISATDWVEGGWTVDDSVVLAGKLKARGCNLIDVSSGGLDPGQKIALGPGYQVPFAERIRRETGIATMAVGMISDARQAEAIIGEGRADMVALARAMMDDPRWAWHAARQLGAETAYSPMYARCRPEVWRPVSDLD
jgi:2,4-dienoyl-CoA reductase-like NADH-dependent reductase (Old Yellow Enzyme family)